MTRRLRLRPPLRPSAKAYSPALGPLIVCGGICLRIRFSPPASPCASPTAPWKRVLPSCRRSSERRSRRVLHSGLLTQILQAKCPELSLAHGSSRGFQQLLDDALSIFRHFILTIARHVVSCYLGHFFFGKNTTLPRQTDEIDRLGNTTIKMVQLVGRQKRTATISDGEVDRRPVVSRFDLKTGCSGLILGRLNHKPGFLDQTKRAYRLLRQSATGGLTIQVG